jgi:aspartyl-tRNA(Asn)/glutamyl-tRNA(Gln) amidotransferase subunit B
VTNQALPTGWEVVMGLEVHAELKTATKLFCGCPNEFGAEPNTNVCPVCLGLPGSLPVLNRQAVELAMRIGVALGCEIRPSIFHRKNYFYPDMPKDYQVSQYDEPINTGGLLPVGDGVVRIERAHLEEDTGKTTHMGGSGRIHGSDFSLVDYNRSGVPLVEIVSAPDIRSSEQAKAYVEELRGVLVATGASDGRMEEGSLRVDANVSVRRAGEEFGTRCEIKNLNSLRSLVRATTYEARRQVELIESGGQVEQQTRHWNESEGRTTTARSKEEAEDYRYFPEPDLVPVAPGANWVDAVRTNLPPLPAQRRAELAARVPEAPSIAVATVVSLGLDQVVLQAMAAGADGRLAINRAANEVAADPSGGARLTPEAFARVVLMESGGELTPTQAKAVIAELLEKGGDPDTVVAERGFQAVGADQLEEIVAGILAAHPDEASRIGEDPKLMGFFVGKVMDATNRQANGKDVTALLRRHAAG